jgi:hypothetical protein
VCDAADARDPPTPEILKLIADIDEFKGGWKAVQTLAPERLTGLKRIAAIESTGSSTRIKGAKLTDQHDVLLKYSKKDQGHRGHSKKVPNHAEAFGPDGKSLGVVLETATPRC